MYSPLVITFANPKPILDLEILVLVPVSPSIRREFINSTIYFVQLRGPAVPALPFSFRLKGNTAAGEQATPVSTVRSR